LVHAVQPLHSLVTLQRYCAVGLVRTLKRAACVPELHGSPELHRSPENEALWPRSLEALCVGISISPV
jgi:hypothetical protein